MAEEGWFQNNEIKGVYKQGGIMPKVGDPFFIEGKRHRVSEVQINATATQWTAKLVTNEEFEAALKKENDGE